MKRIILSFILCLLFSFAKATNYYVSESDGSNSDNGLTPATAWQTISKVRSSMGLFGAGDSVLFKRGDSFLATPVTLWTDGGDAIQTILSITESGSVGNPLVFGAYGTGAKPKFTGNSTSSELEYMIYVSGQSYITIRDWDIIDTTLTNGGLTEQSNIQRAVTFSTSDHCELIKCNISRVGVALFVEEGTYCLMDSCEVSYSKIIVNTPGGVDDYGGNSVILDVAENCRITHNYFHDCYAESFDFGLDGGAVEFNGNCVNNYIGYNTFYNGIAVSEFGSNHSSSDIIEDNIFAYNKFLNNGSLFYVNNSGPFSVNVNNVQWYNNVIVETQVGPLNESKMFSAASAPASGMFVMKNNVWYMTTGIDVCQSGQWTGGALTHENNIYKLSGGSTANFTLGGSELSTSATLWTTTTGDVRTWNFVPSVSSPLIDFGADVNEPVDFAGDSTDANPNAGTHESVVGSVSPTVTTTTITSIASTTASSGGNVTSDGGDAVTVRGVCWNTSTNPTTANSTTSNGTGTGSFTSSITGLSAGVTYYVRAYATNGIGTSYGGVESFTTLNVPTLTTTAATSITTTTASSGGNISSDGGAAVTARGVCWNTSANPTTALGTKTTNGTGTGSFTSSVTGLSANTLYYLRSYSTNSVGTSYGNQVTFTTSSSGCAGCIITMHKFN